MGRLKRPGKMRLSALFVVAVMVSIWIATIGQASSNPAGDGRSDMRIEDKASSWHKDMKKNAGGEDKDRAVDEGTLADEQRDALLDIYTRFKSGEISWEEKHGLLEEVEFDFGRDGTFGHGPKWKPNEDPAQVL